MSEEVPEPLRLLRVREAADRLGLSENQVFEMIRKGELRSVKLGASRRVRSDVLEAFIRSLPEGGAA